MDENIVANESFYVVQGWMRNVLGLRGNALDIYAIIYGFSQVSHQEFTASINYLCEWLGASRPTIINTLKDLVEEGYLTKVSTEKNGIIYNRYTAVTPEQIGSKEFLLGGKKILLGSKKILPNNIDNNIDNKSLPKGKGEQAPSREKKLSYANILSDENNKYIAEALQKFLKYCEGKNYTPKISTVKGFAEMLRTNAGDNIELAFKIVDQSINNGWKALYTLKRNTGGVSTKKEAVSTPVSKEDKAKNPDGSYVVY